MDMRWGGGRRTSGILRRNKWRTNVRRVRNELSNELREGEIEWFLHTTGLDRGVVEKKVV